MDHRASGLPSRRIRRATLSPEEVARLEELARARFTRVQEFEADLLGALYATRAGFDGFGGALRWMNLAAERSQLGVLDE